MIFEDIVGKKVIRIFRKKKTYEAYPGLPFLQWTIEFDDGSWIRFEGELQEISMEMGKGDKK